MNTYFSLLFIASQVSCLCFAQSNKYLWLNETVSERSIVTEICPPEGYERIDTEPGSFSDWLRHLPLKEQGSPVLLYNRSEKFDQNVHHAVIDMDIGTEDIQQCADAVIRLRAEYLYSMGNFDAIQFKFTSGDVSSFSRWASGIRPVVKNGNQVTWRQSAVPDSSYANFRSYLNNLFYWAGSYSLSRELTSRENINHIQIGDVFIHGGFPGHAVIVVDMAQNKQTGDMVFMIAQSYMPAQEVHILKNPDNAFLSPWYQIPAGNQLDTPEWTFQVKELKYFE